MLRTERPFVPAPVRRPFRDNPRLILAGIAVLVAVLIAILIVAERTSRLSPDFLTEVVLYALSVVGIATSARLAALRRYVILVIAVFAALVTPGGDIISPLVLGGTMYVLFEVTVFVIKRTGK